MARDRGLEELISSDLGARPGLMTKTMFGGLAWMLNGHLLCGVRTDGLLVRLGKGNDGWALAMDGVSPMQSGTRPMAGWVRVAPLLCADEATRTRFLLAAIAFVEAQAPK